MDEEKVFDSLPPDVQKLARMGLAISRLTEATKDMTVTVDVPVRVRRYIKSRLESGQ